MEFKENAAVGKPVCRSRARTFAEVPQCFQGKIPSEVRILCWVPKTDSFFFLSDDASSINSAAYDPLVILDTMCRVKVGECLLLDETRSSFIAHQPSEQSYLNLTSPSASAVTAAPLEGATDPDKV